MYLSAVSASSDVIDVVPSLAAQGIRHHARKEQSRHLFVPELPGLVDFRPHLRPSTSSTVPPSTMSATEIMTPGSPAIQLNPLPAEPNGKQPRQTTKSASCRPQTAYVPEAPDHVSDAHAASAVASTERAERWNDPSGNMARVAATFLTFLVMGANDAAYGVS